MNIFPIKKFIDRREEIFNLLKQLTDSPVIDREKFITIINNLPENHNIYVYILDDKIVGMITIFTEQKLIHNARCVAHIEDLVVDKNYLNKGIAKQLINYCLNSIDTEKYYKIILNCSENLISFYEKFGFDKKNIQMSKYF